MDNDEPRLSEHADEAYHLNMAHRGTPQYCSLHKVSYAVSCCGCGVISRIPLDPDRLTVLQQIDLRELFRHPVVVEVVKPKRGRRVQK